MMPKHLLLNGFMGSGKSTVGRLVAARAGVPFTDLDLAVESAAAKPIPAIFADSGEAGFRALEAAALSHALATPSPRVVALGGGALLDPATRRDALGRACIITLTARPATLSARTAGTGRPLLEGAADREARIRELLAARAAAYAEAHAQIATDGLTPAAVVDAVMASWQEPAIAVALGTRSYTVRLAHKSPEAVACAVAVLAPSAAFVVTDSNVDPIAGPALCAALSERGVRLGGKVVLAPGEANKNLAAVEQALTQMVLAQADRDAVVVALGGGVVSDIAGFAAATLLRGVRWVSVPTTLLAMVDASVGGKTGVDLGPAKNAVGAFHQPAAVVVGADYTRTESETAYTSGLAEVVKAGAIGDPALIELLEHDLHSVRARERVQVEQMVLRAVGVKAAIVARDEREAGERAWLNFGHTLGHGLEAAGGFTRLTHGQAVSLGMAAALHLGELLGFTDPAVAQRITKLLADLGLPVRWRDEPLEEALRLVLLDKKRKDGLLRVVLLRGIGAPLVHGIRAGDFRRLLLST